jgi:hypothetical protein
MTTNVTGFVTGRDGIKLSCIKKTPRSTFRLEEVILFFYKPHILQAISAMRKIIDCL